MRHDMNNVLINGKSMMTEIDLIIHIVSSVPDDYDIPVSILKDLLMSSSGKQLDLQTVRDKISAHFDRLKLHKDELKDNTALVSVSENNDQEIDRKMEDDENADEVANVYGRQVKSNCCRCGRYGCDGGYRCPENATNKNRNQRSSLQNVRSTRSNFGNRQNFGSRPGTSNSSSNRNGNSNGN